MTTGLRRRQAWSTATLMLSITHSTSPPVARTRPSGRRRQSQRPDDGHQRQPEGQVLHVDDVRRQPGAREEPRRPTGREGGDDARSQARALRPATTQMYVAIPETGARSKKRRATSGQGRRTASRVATDHTTGQPRDGQQEGRVERRGEHEHEGVVEQEGQAAEPAQHGQGRTPPGLNHRPDEHRGTATTSVTSAVPRAEPFIAAGTAQEAVVEVGPQAGRGRHQGGQPDGEPNRPDAGGRRRRSPDPEVDHLRPRSPEGSSAVGQAVLGHPGRARPPLPRGRSRDARRR